MTEPPTIFDRDAEHLSILRVLHYVFGGLEIAASAMGLIYVVLGVVAYANPQWMHSEQGGTPPPKEFFLILAIFGGCFTLIGTAFGVLTIMSARHMAGRRHRVFSIVIAAINCISFPLGTLLGVFTIVVLCRDTVRAAYGEIPMPLREPPPAAPTTQPGPPAESR